MTSTKTDQLNTSQFNRDLAPERDILAESLDSGKYIDEFTFLVKSPSRRPFRESINAALVLVLAPFASR